MKPAKPSIERHLAAARLTAIPDDLHTPRHPGVDPETLSGARKATDLASEVWLAGDSDSGRLAALEANRAAFDAYAGLGQRLADILTNSYAQLEPSEIEYALGEAGLLDADNPFLSEAERAALDHDGYVSLGPLLDEPTLRDIRERLDAAAAEEGNASGSEVSQTVGISRLSGTVLKAMNRDGLFDVFYMQPRLLAATRHVLGPRFKMSSSNFHCPLPGFGHQSIHADWGWTVRTPEVVNAIWMLDDFTVDNGPTRVVPGTHRRGHPFGTALTAPGRTPYDPVPGETVLTGPAGTCVVYNAHLWHGGTQNRTAGLRRSLHSYFTRSCRPTQTRTLEVIDPLVHARLDRVRRAILDVPEWVAER